MVIQTDRMLCAWRTFCKSGTSGKTHFHQESELGNHIRNVQMFLRNRRSCTDPENEIPTSDCLATTGPSMFTESKQYIGPRLPARTIVQGYGRDKEIVVLHIEQSDEFRGIILKSSNKSLQEYDDRHITRADLPFATIGVFHIRPSISHGAAREDLQNEIMPLVTLYRCDAITGDANKSANTYSKLQHVFNPANGLVNILMRAYQRLWNGHLWTEWSMQWRLRNPLSVIVWIRMWSNLPRCDDDLKYLDGAKRTSSRLSGRTR